MNSDFLTGGVTSGWNSFRVTGKTVVSKADGCHIWSEDGKEYIDWIMGWGSLILGHKPKEVMDAIRDSFDIGFGFQYESPIHGELAKAICDVIPSAEKVRLANSGTEATLHAVRVARHVTGKKRIIKFEGHFHGVNDYLMFGLDNQRVLGEMNASGHISPIAASGGLPYKELSELITVVPWNDFDAVQKAFEQFGDEIAGIILEPVALNIGCIYPVEGYLQFLRDICDQYGALLIFDEVLTGFRSNLGGAQAIFGVMPDLSTFGKAMGCGMPVAALAGKAEYMQSLAPVGKVEMAGTNTGRLMTVCGTLAAINTLKKTDPFSQLNRMNDYFADQCRKLLDSHAVPGSVVGFGGRIGIFLGMEELPVNYREIVSGWNEPFHLACYKEAYENMGLFGFLLPLNTCPEPVTMSSLHDKAIVDETLNRFESILKKVRYPV